jgi:serine/threonine protein phosphatase PrpC
MQGWRNTQEDSHITETVKLGPDMELFGVFDGHGGHQVAHWVKDHYVNLLVSLDAYKNGDYKLALE